MFYDLEEPARLRRRHRALAGTRRHLGQRVLYMPTMLEMNSFDTVVPRAPRVLLARRDRARARERRARGRARRAERRQRRQHPPLRRACGSARAAARRIESTRAPPRPRARAAPRRSRALPGLRASAWRVSSASCSQLLRELKSRARRSTSTAPRRRATRRSSTSGSTRRSSTARPTATRTSGAPRRSGRTSRSSPRRIRAQSPGLLPGAAVALPRRVRGTREEFFARGGKFIIPLPDVHLIDGSPPSN